MDNVKILLFYLMMGHNVIVQMIPLKLQIQNVNAQMENFSLMVLVLTVQYNSVIFAHKQMYVPNV